MRLAMLSLMVLLSPGCSDQGLCIENPAGEAVARIASPITLRKGVVRTRESVIGNLAADSVWHGFNGNPAMSEDGRAPRCKHLDSAAQRCIDIAMTNAGGLRAESACGERNEWREGEIVRRDVDQLMPFANEVVAIGVTGRQLYEAYEQGVAFLGQPGRFAWGGGFLHSSGALVMVDCGASPRLVDEQGNVRSDQVGSRVVMICTRRHGDQNGQDPTWEEVVRDDNEERIYRVGVNSFLAGGGDSFRMWVTQSADGTIVPQILVEPGSPGSDQNLMATYLNELSKGGSEDFDPNARTRLPTADQDACALRLEPGDPSYSALSEDPHCQVEDDRLVCRFDPSSRLTFLRRNLCYP